MGYILKRKDTGRYVYRYVKDGQTKQIALDTADLATAKGRAKDLDASIDAGNWKAVAKVSNADKGATIAQVVNVFERTPIEILGYKTTNTKTKSISALRCILRTMGRSFEGTPVAVLDDAFVLEYEMTVLRQADDFIAKAQPALKPADAAHKRSRASLRIASYLANAKMLFQPGLMPTYKAAGLTLPDMTEFLHGGRVKVPKASPRLMPAAELEEWKAAFSALRDTDPATYVAYLLCYGLALRKSEAVAIRWTWLTFNEQTGAGLAHIAHRPEEGFSPKGTAGAVPFGRNLWEGLRRYGNVDGEYILSGIEWKRTQIVQDRINGFMRSRGWTATKAAHALRAWRGQEWWTQYSPQQCSAWMRHSSFRTTQEHYAGLTPGNADLRVDI